MVTLFLCGDVMTGRGVDQILEHPVDPTLREAYLHDASDYVDLAEKRSGAIPRKVDDAWVWGDALEELERRALDARIINLETSVTADGHFEEGKEIHYRMHPRNAGLLKAARIDVCVLGNNHVLDFGRGGLEDTLDALDAQGVAHAGAGRNAEEARRPAELPLPGGGRVLVFSLAAASSGVPSTWEATADSAGVDYLGKPSKQLASEVAARIEQIRRPEDTVVVSIHWGSNWGYEVPEEHVHFAHRLIDGGVDLVHGHSSHHPRPIEVYQRKLILYGCGDFIDDYEGIAGYEEFRGDLVLMYFPELSSSSGELVGLRMTPLQIRKMQLVRPTSEDVRWLQESLNRASRNFGVSTSVGDDQVLTLEGT